jgi:NADPH:quinone reductase-like Zn-dependent oxidoreductase
VEPLELPGPGELRPDEVLLEVHSRDGGRLATITSDPPDPERGIEVSQVYVAPDGPRLARLGELLAAAAITITTSAPFPLDQAAAALAYLHQGTNGQAVVLRPGPVRR